MSGTNISHPEESLIIAHGCTNTLPRLELTCQYHQTDRSDEWNESSAVYLSPNSPYTATYSDSKTASYKDPTGARHDLKYRRPNGAGLTDAMALELNPSLARVTKNRTAAYKETGDSRQKVVNRFNARLNPFDSKLRKWVETSDHKSDLKYDFTTELFNGKSVKGRLTAHWRGDTDTISPLVSPKTTPNTKGSATSAVDPDAWMYDFIEI